MFRKPTRAAAHGVAGLALSVLLYGPLRAHGDVHGQIVALTARIAKEPRNAELYLRRGELHRVHGDLKAALTDFRSALRFDPKLDAVELCAGRALLEAKRPKEARPRLERFLARHAGSGEALTLHARTLAALGERVAAAADYSRAIALEEAPRPDLFIERARSLAAAGRREEALTGLDEGLARLGDAPALELEAIDLEVALARPDDALRRLARLGDSSERKEAWDARRGQVLESAGRREEAREAYEEALRHIHSLPDRMRGTRAIAELEERVLSALARLKS